MPKRTDGTCEEGAQLKKTKMENMAIVCVDANLEFLQSRYSLEEAFSRLPRELLVELLDYLDVHHASRLCRVSHTWKAVLMNGPMRNHDTAVLQQPSVRRYPTGNLGNTLWLAQVCGRRFFLVKPRGIKHFIFIGQFASSFGAFVCEFVKKGYIISKSLNKITFCEDELDTVAHWTKLPESVKYINLVNCTFSVGRVRFQLSPQDEFVAAAIATMGKDYRYQSWAVGIEWHVSVFVPHLEFTSFVEEGAEVESYQMELKRKMDAYNLIWPYPEEQLQWLLNTLEGLEGTVLQSVKYTDKVCLSLRKRYRMVRYRTLDLTTNATCDGRILDTLDLAFFGRLLVCMNKVKAIRGFQPPPFEFPDDFKYI